MGTTPGRINYIHSGYSQGIGNTAAYMVSGYPYITGSTTMKGTSEMEIKFPWVTKRITVINRSDEEIRVHFSPAGSGNADGSALAGSNNVIGRLHYITLDTTEDSIDMQVKVDRMYITGDGSSAAHTSFQVFAELTSIPTGSLGRLHTNASDTDGVGWPGISD
tara:strand:- start:202 stop:690 length:489 start_codon:yes stop_codon:yes gene_type:complete